jgi:hypothetical protein
MATKVLLIEDSIESRILVERVLGASGYDMYYAA